MALLPRGFSHLRLHFLQLSFSCYSQSQCLAQLRSSLKFVLNLMPVILKSCTGNQTLVIWSACYKFYIWHMSCSSSPLLPRSFLWLRLSLGRFVRLFNSRGRLVASLIRVSKLKLSSSYRHWRFFIFLFFHYCPVMYDFDPLVLKVLFGLGFQVSIVLFRLSNSLPVGNIEIVSSLTYSY